MPYTDQYQKRLGGLYEHVLELGKSKSILEIAKRTLRIIEQILGFDRGGLGLVENGDLRFVYTTGKGVKEPPNLPLNGPGVTVRAVRTGESQLVPDTRKDTDFLHIAEEERLSELAVPVKLGERVMAVINLESNSPSAFNEQDRKLLEIFAEHVASAIQRLRLLESERLQRLKITALHQSVDELARVKNKEEVYAKALRTIQDVLGFRSVRIGLVGNGAVQFIGHDGLEGSEISLDTPSTVVRAIKTRQSQIVTDSRRDLDYLHLPRDAKLRRPASELAVPVILNEKVVAVVNIENSELNALRDEDKKLIEILAMHMGSALSRLNQVENLQKQEARLAALHDSALRLVDAKNLDEIARITIAALKYSLGFEVAEYLELKNSILSVRAIEGEETQQSTNLRLPLDGKGITVRAAKTGRTTLVTDTTLDLDYVEGSGHTLSELAVPVKVANEVVAVLNVESRQVGNYKEEDVKLMETLAMHVSSAIDHLRHVEYLEKLVEDRTQKLKEVQRMATIGETAAMVGHDLRNPLQVIVNTLYLMKKSNERMPPSVNELLAKGGQLEFFETIQRQADYMNKIVSNLQDYAKTMKLELVETSLHDLVSEVMKADVTSPRIKVSFNDQLNSKIMVDQTLMKRMLDNLILNALQAMPDGGQLGVELSETEEDVIMVIQDTGIGIPEDNLNKMFQPLFTTKPKGTGLGLPVCKRIVEAHGGDITVESQVGKGSTFTVRIPKKRQD